MSEQSPLEPLDPELGTLFEAERRHPAEPAAAQARVWKAVAASLVVAPIAAGVGAALSPKASGLAAAKAFGLGKLAAASAALFVVGGVAGAVVQHTVIEPMVAPRAEGVRTPALEAPVALPAPALEARDAGAAVAPEVVPVPVERPRSRSTAHPAPEQEHDVRVAEPSSALAREQAIIDAARAGLARGHGDDALTALDRHEREFPAGSLTEEREGLRVLALVRVGHRVEAAESAASFRARYPRSVLLPAIDTALAGAK
jgi:hypothetical protein